MFIDKSLLRRSKNDKVNPYRLKLSATKRKSGYSISAKDLLNESGLDESTSVVFIEQPTSCQKQECVETNMVVYDSENHVNHICAEDEFYWYYSWVLEEDTTKWFSSRHKKSDLTEMFTSYSQNLLIKDQPLEISVFQTLNYY